VCTGEWTNEPLAGGGYAIQPRDAGPSDAAIISRVLDGDTEAFGLLVDRYESDLAKYARWALGNEDEAADAVQDALVRAYRSLHRCTDPTRFQGWLFRIVSNRCKTMLARQRRRTERIDDLPADPPLEDGGPGEDAEREERRERLRRALEELSPDHREALVLRYVNEMGVPAIAEALDLSVSAVKMRLHRGREALRAVLQGEGGA
jgi:RNA polymerase sigma-70 factor, ECF subfamily